MLDCIIRYAILSARYHIKSCGYSSGNCFYSQRIHIVQTQIASKTRSSFVGFSVYVLVERICFGKHIRFVQSIWKKSEKVIQKIDIYDDLRYPKKSYKIIYCFVVFPLSSTTYIIGRVCLYTLLSNLYINS